ncbi:thermonuclease family protein [Amycolatopsis sp. NPDC004368]
MNPTPAPARPRKRFPKWLMATLGVFVVLFVLGAIFGKAPQTPTQPVAAPAAATPTAPTTTTSAPPPVTYTVDKVVDGATVELAGSDGTHRTVHVLGVTVATGSNCYAVETLAWATSKLAGTAVKLTTDTTTGVALALADGSDYATAALQNGYAKFAADATSTALQTAETTARQATAGLWAAPCKGAIDAPTPQPPAPPVTTKKEAPAPPPQTHEDPPPADDPDVSLSFKNCTEARAAGVTPLHRGEPGYSRKLDRDGDGVACE